MFHIIADGARPNGLSAEKDFRAAIAFYPNCRFSREPKWKPSQRLLFLTGEADNFLPPAACKQLLSAAVASGSPPIEEHWYPGAHQVFDHPNMPERVFTNIKLPPDGRSPTLGSKPQARAPSLR